MSKVGETYSMVEGVLRVAYPMGFFFKITTKNETTNPTENFFYKIDNKNNIFFPAAKGVA